MRASTELLRQAGHAVFWIGGKIVGSLPELDGHRLIPELDRLGLLSDPKTVSLVKRQLLETLDGFSPDIVHLVDQFEGRIQRALCRRYPVVVSAHLVALTCPASTRLVPPSGQCTHTSGLKCLVHHAQQNCLSHFSSFRARAVAVADYKWRRGSLAGAERILAVSRYVTTQLLADGWPREKVRTVYNPVSLPATVAPLPPALPLRLVATTRLVPYKGVQVLLQALATLKDRAWTLSVAGTGSYAEALKIESARLKLSDRVTFHGQLSFADVERLVADSHVLVQPNSGPEPFGLSVAEAMAAGRAVIVSDVPALNETVQDDRNGLIVPAGDAIALAQAIRRFYLEPGLAARLGKAGREAVAKRFSPQAHLEATVASYQDVLKSRLGLSGVLKTEAV